MEYVTYKCHEEQFEWVMEAINNRGTSKSKFRTTEDLDKAITKLEKECKERGEGCIKGYMYKQTLLDAGCKFYYDEGFNPDDECGGYCDCCENLGEYMTSTDGEGECTDGSDYYMCRECIGKYELVYLLDDVEKKDYIKGTRENAPG